MLASRNPTILNSMNDYGRIIVDVSPRQVYLLGQAVLTAFLGLVGSSTVVTDKVGIFQPYFALRCFKIVLVLDVFFYSVLTFLFNKRAETRVSELIEFYVVVLRYVIVKDLYQEPFLYSMMGDLLDQVLETDPGAFDGFIDPLFESKDPVSKGRGVSCWKEIIKESRYELIPCRDLGGGVLSSHSAAFPLREKGKNCSLDVSFVAPSSYMLSTIRK
nr:hypothetical protein [Tanacetum cinerariifolium]